MNHQSTSCAKVTSFFNEEMVDKQHLILLFGVTRDSNVAFGCPF